MCFCVCVCVYDIVIRRVTPECWWRCYGGILPVMVRVLVEVRGYFPPSEARMRREYWLMRSRSSSDVDVSTPLVVLRVKSRRGMPICKTSVTAPFSFSSGSSTWTWGEERRGVI